MSTSIIANDDRSKRASDGRERDRRDPDIAEFQAAAARVGGAARALGRGWLGRPVAADVAVSDVDLGGISGEWSSVPGSDQGCVLLYFHGGGYCSGSLRSHRRLVSEAGRAAAMRALAVAYRLAPEHPFPAALDDALTAWRFLQQLGIPSSQIAVAGDSAGGGLTVALINHLRAAGAEQPACVWLLSPGPT